MKTGGGGIRTHDNGFAIRPRESASDGATTSYDDADPALTALLTDIARIDPDLAGLVEVWSILSEQVRADILAVVTASQQVHSATECK